MKIPESFKQAVKKAGLIPDGKDDKTMSTQKAIEKLDAALVAEGEPGPASRAAMAALEATLVGKEDILEPQAKEALEDLRAAIA